MYSVFQEIVKLSEDPSVDGEIMGYEHLTRFETDETPEQAFKQAKKCGQLVQLEMEANAMGIKNFCPPVIGNSNPYIALNVSASTITATDGALVKDPGLHISWPRIALELSEKDEVLDYLALYPSLERVKENQALISIDDFGVGYSGLRSVLQLQPDIIKIDRTFITNIDENEDKRSIVKAVVALAKGRAVVVAEGIETEAEKAWCTILGVDCGQGFLFGMPKPFR